VPENFVFDYEFSVCERYLRVFILVETVVIILFTYVMVLLKTSLVGRKLRQSLSLSNCDATADWRTGDGQASDGGRSVELSPGVPAREPVRQRPADGAQPATQHSERETGRRR